MWGELKSRDESVVRDDVRGGFKGSHSYQDGHVSSL